MTRYVVGVDGGGTKTNVAIADEHGRLLGSGTAGPSNYVDVGDDTARENVAQAVAQARAEAGLPARPFDAAFLGMAGVISATDRSHIRAIANALALAPDDHIGIDHDCRIALAGGLSGRPGIVQIAGTGSSCYGRNAAGEDWRSGGWGELVADEGSSYWFGLQAMTAAVRSFDGRLGPTVLLDRVLARLKLDDINDIMHLLYVTTLSRAEIASLAPLVITAAQEGDTVAQHLIIEGMEHLAACIEAVARRLGFAADGCDVALVGGLFRAGETVVAPLRTAVAARVPTCRLLLAELPPVHGACVLARQRLSTNDQ